MKASLVFFLFLFSAVMVCAQTKTAADMEKDNPPIKYIERIVGTWRLQQIVDVETSKKSTMNRPKGSPKNNAGRPTSKTDQSRNAMRLIEFNPNARYKMNNTTTVVDSGSFRVNEQHGLLYLESDADDVSPTEWNMTMEDNVLTLVGRGQDAENRYKYIYRRQR